MYQENDELLLPLQRSSVKGSSDKSLRIPHFDISVLYISEPDELERVVDAAD